jgi:hypothetical protein
MRSSETSPKVSFSPATRAQAGPEEVEKAVLGEELRAVQENIV